MDALLAGMYEVLPGLEVLAMCCLLLYSLVVHCLLAVDSIVPEVWDTCSLCTILTWARQLKFEYIAPTTA